VQEVVAYCEETGKSLVSGWEFYIGWGVISHPVILDVSLFACICVDVLLLLLLCRRLTVRIPTSAVNWQLRMFEVCKVNILVTSELVPAASISQYTQDRRMCRHHDCPLMSRHDAIQYMIRYRDCTQKLTGPASLV